MRASGLAAPMLLRAALGLRLECVMVDVLHTVDAGLSAHVCGNVIWWLAIVYNVVGVPTYAKRMEACQSYYKTWVGSTKCKNKLRRES